MSLKKLSFIHFISMVISLVCVALCFQGCGQNSTSTKTSTTHHKPLIPLANGSWRMTGLDFKTQNQALTPADDALSQIQTGLNGTRSEDPTRNWAQNPILTLTINELQAQIVLDFTTPTTPCTVSLSGTLEYGKTHCGCNTLKLSLDPHSAQESTPNCSQTTVNLSLSEITNALQAQFGMPRVFTYTQGASTFNLSPKNNGSRSSFNFEQ